MGKIYDVIVVGGGPAGLYTAKILAEEGLEVLLLEEKREVGKEVICTGIVGREIFEKFDVSKDSILREVKEVRFISPFGTEIHYTHPFPFAFVIDREKFDRSLCEKALMEGVDIKLSHRVLDAEITKKGVMVKVRDLRALSQREFVGKFLVLATGVKIWLSKKLGLGYPVDFIKSAQKVVEYIGDDFITVITGSSISQGAFGWIVPEGNRVARVGLMTEGDPKKGFENMIKRFFKSDKIDGVKYKPIAQGLISKSYGERVISVGECAGQVKTTTGGGVYFGLLCAEIAAEAILKAFKKEDFSSERLSWYEKRWKGKVGKEIKTGYFLRKLCGRLEDEKIEKLFALAQSDGFINYIGKNAKFDWHALTLLKLIGKKEVREIFGNLVGNLLFL